MTDVEHPHPSRHAPQPAAGRRRRAGQPLRAGAEQLADQAGDHRRALPGRRRHRRLRAAADRGADQEPGQAVHHRQQGRRRRHARRRRGGARRARRLHAVHGRGAPRDRAVDVPEARLQHRDRLRAHRPGLERAAGDRGQPAARAGGRPEGPARLPAQEPGQAELRARPATAPATTWPASCSSCRPRPSSPTSPTAAPARRCRT